MITAWQIYWVMQLDTIGTAAVLLTMFGTIPVLFAWVAHFDNDTKLNVLAPLVLTAGWGLILAVAVFLPSTKTAAAMVVIPAVANNETIQREAGDLYGIAKDALRELARPKNAEKSK